MKKKDILLAIGLIVFAVMFRLIPGTNNFSPLIGVALFGGYIFKNNKLGLLLPVLIYLMSDILIQLTGGIGFYGTSQIFVYSGILLVALLGTTLNSPKALKLFGYAISGALVFFIISNFGVWVGSKMAGSIEHDATLTLGMTYVRALPFYNQFSNELFFNLFISSIGFTLMIFGLHAVVHKTVLNNNTVKA